MGIIHTNYRICRVKAGTAGISIDEWGHRGMCAILDMGIALLEVSTVLAQCTFRPYCCYGILKARPLSVQYPIKWQKML